MPVLSIKIVLGGFLSAYFLFLEILNLNLTFAVNVILNLSNVISSRNLPLRRTYTLTLIAVYTIAVCTITFNSGAPAYFKQRKKICK